MHILLSDLMALVFLRYYIQSFVLKLHDDYAMNYGHDV